MSINGLNVDEAMGVVDAELEGRDILRIKFEAYTHREHAKNAFVVDLHDDAGPGVNMDKLSKVFAKMAAWERTRSNGPAASKMLHCNYCGKKTSHFVTYGRTRCRVCNNHR